MNISATPKELEGFYLVSPRESDRKDVSISNEDEILKVQFNKFRGTAMKPKIVVTIIALITTYIIGCCMLVVILNFLLSEPVTFTWVMDRGALLNETYIVKMCPDGTRILDVQFGQSGAIGVDPFTGSVWAPELNDRERINEDQVVNIDANGNIINRYNGYRTGVLAVDPNDGSVWVGLVNEHQLVKLDSNGEIILRVYGFSAPAAIAIDPIDSSVWVADHTPPSTLIHIAANGDELFRMNTTGFWSSAYHQVAVDPQTGYVWFIGANEGKVYQLSSRGDLLATIDGFDRPVSVSINPSDGGVWVADFSVESQGAIVRLDPDGERIRSVVLDSPPRVAIVNPYDGTIWVGIEEALIKLSDDGEILETLTGFTLPKSIAFYQTSDDVLTKLSLLFTCW